MALSVQYWANYTSGRSKLQRKSENAVACNRVLRFETHENIVKAVVQASMRDKSYKVEVSENLTQRQDCQGSIVFSSFAF